MSEPPMTILEVLDVCRRTLGSAESDYVQKVNPTRRWDAASEVVTVLVELLDQIVRLLDNKDEP